MNTENTVNDLNARLMAAIPVGLAGVRHDLDNVFRGILQGGIEKMNLVSREEFDVQRAVLARTREKLAALEARIAELEQQLSTDR
jgi:ubiquinone biosynthesis accessory factor UbiK